MGPIFYWIQDHLLGVVAILITIVLLYHYLIEKDRGVKLTKKYRNSIYEAQSKIFLNATQYLILGHKDLAIKEFLNAVDLNRETLETYFALGGLFRSNGEIEKAISIHRSLIARSNISESARLRALKELAIDFDKGGFIDKATETYKDVLKINRDQDEVILALCRIYEDIEDWDEAYKYRMVLSRVIQEGQSETISHILVQKAKSFFESGEFALCMDALEDAFRFAPSVSAKILKLKLLIVEGNMEDSKLLLIEILKEYPLYISFIFVTLNEKPPADHKILELYNKRLDALKEIFLSLKDKDLLESSSFILSKVRLLKDQGKIDQAYSVMKEWMERGKGPSQILKLEFAKILISLNRYEEAMTYTVDLLNEMHHDLTRHFCDHCGYNSDHIFWRCPQCKEWETIKFRWKL